MPRESISDDDPLEAEEADFTSRAAIFAAAWQNSLFFLFTLVAAIAMAFYFCLLRALASRPTAARFVLITLTFAHVRK
jgi:hypothetical protein